MAIKQIKLFIFFACLITFILSEVPKFENIQISYSEFSFPQINYNSISYEILFENDLKKYLHFSVKSLSDYTQIVSLSTTDKDCLHDRKLIGMQPYEPINLFFSTEQIPKNKILYLCIQCKNEENCEHETTIDSEDTCQLSIGEQYSYYVSDNYSEKLTFKFKSESETNNSLRRLDSLDSIVNFWVKGEKIKSTQLNKKDTEIEGKSFINGKIYKTEFDSNSDYDLTVESEVGDYVTIGSLYVDNQKSNQLKINGLEVMLLLDSDFSEVCFPIEPSNELIKASISGQIYTKKAIFYLKAKEEILKGTETNITNGILSEVLIISEEKYSICMKHHEYKNTNFNTILSLQLTSHEYKNYNQFIYAPQISGIIYEHILFKNQIALFRGAQPRSDSKEINYNMKAINGFPDMLFSNLCDDFPNCNYDVTDLTNLEDPSHSNRMTLYSFYLDEENRQFSPISGYQPLFVVNCVDASFYEDSEICRFQTSIYTDKDPLYLVEGEAYSQFLLKEERDLYVIDIEQEEDLEKVYLDLMIFSGDVYFDIDSSIDAHKYFLSNKIFYSIQVNKGDKRIEFSVTAGKNSFYLIQYQLVHGSNVDSDKTNILESGVNYLESIYVGEGSALYKYIDLLNFKASSDIPYLVSFYSQNCKFIISRKKENSETEFEYIYLYDNYGQAIIDKDDYQYKHSKFRFMIDITGDESSDFNKKLCMLYVTGLELSNTNTGTERSISVSEGVPQFYIFSEKYPVIKYSYHVSDVSNTLVLQFNLVDKAPYKVTISFRDYFKETTIHRNIQLFVYSSELSTHCKYKDEVCTVNVNIELERKNRDRRLETTIYQINGAPIYLEKNVVKQDILIGSVRKYYFMDIGKDETGDITIDYKRGSGYINAKVVKKQLTEVQEYPEWRGIYQFPKSKEESLPYETYLKKIVISNDDTQDCDDGCYLLITVINSVYREGDEFDEKAEIIPYRITLTPTIIPRDAYDPQSEDSLPKVKILANEFVIGNVFSSEQKIYNFYTINLPYDSEYLIIDWQADKPSLFINVGTDRPGLKEDEYDYKLESVDHDTVFKLTKTQIIDKAIEKEITIPNENSMRFIDLTLGVWTNQIDSLYTSVYAFKIFMPPTYIEEESANRLAFELIHIRSDQKIQCDPIQTEGIYSCIFAVIFDGSDANSSLVVYPRAQSPNVNIHFFGAMVDAEEIEKNNLTYISQYTMEPSEEYSSADGKKYIYTEKIDLSKCFLLVVDSEKYTIIEVMSSTYTYYEGQIFVPNPSTAQVLALGSKHIKFNFETSQDLLINIVGISGSGFFNWETDKEKNINYFLDGFEDRLTLTSGTDIIDNKLSSLVVQSTSFSWLEENDSGFIFYVTFYPRNTEYNIDQVRAGRSIEINYRQVKFPLNFYTRLTDQDIAISFDFYNYYMEKDDILTYDKPMLEIWGRVIKESEALLARFDEFYKPKKTEEHTVFGVFDGAFGTLFLNSESIKKFNITDDDKPTLFFSVEMVEGVPYNFNGVSVEVSILKEQGEKESQLFAPEHVYLNGKLPNNNPRYRYKLRTLQNNPYMRIEFSANNELIKYAIGTDENIEEHSKELLEVENDYLNGKYLMTFKIPESILLTDNGLFMVVYYKGEKELDSKLANYIFKYMNGKNKESFFSFPQEKDRIEYEIIGNNNGIKDYKISFYPVEHYAVNYYVKAIYKDGKINEEVKNTIAISESEGRYWQIDNPEFDGENKVHLNLLKVEKEISYIKIIAKLDFEAAKEYILYQPIDIYGDDIIIDPETINISPSEKSIPLKFYTQDRKLIGIAENAFKIQKYNIQFDNKNKIPNYIKVEAISKSEKNQILYFSPDNANCKANRKQIGQAGKGNTVNMWIKKEQLEDNDYFYIAVECQVKQNEKCNYVLQFTGYEFPQIESAIFVHNYYVSEENKQMKFRINNILDLSETSDQVLTLYATGGKKINLALSHCLGGCDQIDFKTGAAITTKIQKHMYFELTVTAQEGDFISVGSKITSSNGKSLENTLMPNEYQLSGYLKKNLLEKECYSFPIFDKSDSYYLSGIFYNRIAEISFKDYNFNDIEGDFEVINKGFYSYVHTTNNRNRKYICIGFPSRTKDYDINDIPYSLQLTDPTQHVGLLNFYAPQLRGIIYPRITPKGSVVFFNVANSDSQELIYNMIATEGLPKMYMYKCTSYPVCEFDYNSLDYTEGIIKLNEINRVTNWYNDKEEKDISPIDAEQYIMVVKCEDLNDHATDICQFQTSIFGKDDNIYLIEGQPFSQYRTQGEKDTFIIDFSYDQKITKIHLDTLVVNGDVTFTLRDEKGREVNAHKYYLANKIFYSVTKNEILNEKLNRIIIDIECKINSYYVLEYKLVRGDKTESMNDVYEGINYLIPIPSIIGSNEKLINVHNLRSLSDSKYLTSFYSLNCEFSIERVNRNGEFTSIITYGNYGQDIIDEDSGITDTMHTYQVKVTEQDISKYSNNMCMLYVNALQLTKDNNSPAQKEILIGEGVPQKTVFQSGVNKIRYIYPNAEPDKNLALNFKVITSANYKLILTYNHKESYSDNLSKSAIIYLDKEIASDNCKESQLCNLILEVDVENEYNEMNPIIEITIRKIGNVPYYIPKSVVKQDYLSANSYLYLFTNLGREDQGYISIDFARGSGLIYAKIVKIDEEPEEDPDWRNYKFPKSISESLKYDFYNKKILFSNSNTKDCLNGCYLLITIEPSVRGDLDENYRFFQFSISVGLTPSGTLKQIAPLIEIEPEEYIVGSLLSEEKIKSKDMYEFYKITIPFNAEFVEFDWQSDAAVLLINVGDERPNIDSCHFNYTARSDTVFRLTNEQIKKHLSAGNYITNSHLTIGVYTEDIDSLFGTAYSFKVHFVNKINIYKVSSDQKTLCLPEKINNNEYRCLFMIIYNDLDFVNDLMVYSKSQSSSAEIYMFGKYIDKNIYDNFNIDKLNRNIPNENDKYNTKKEKIDFIFLNMAEMKSHFYVSVISNEPSIIEFITSMKTYDKEISPNPSSIQLFALNNEQKMILNFITQKGLFINIVSIYGSAKLTLQNELDVNYNLRGRDDRLSLAIPPYDGDNTILIIENLNFLQPDESQYEPHSEDDYIKIRPGFAFYIEYYLRSSDMNFDEISLGKTTEIAYKNSDFPLYYYSKLNNFDYSINTFFNLHDLEYIDKEQGTNREIDSHEFSLKGSLIKQKTVYGVKRSEESKPNLDNSPIVGIYDPALKAGQIYFPKKNLPNLGVSLTDEPTIYLAFEKIKDIKYKKIRMEFTAFQENSNIIVTEKLYQYGKIFEKGTTNYYRLKVDNSADGYMRIQFATNNKNIRYTISEEPNSKSNSKFDEFEEKKDVRGKTFITFKRPKNKDYIYLNVFLDDNSGENDLQKNHYVFKYINANSKEKLFEYPPSKDSKIEIKTENNQFKIKFNKINVKDTNVTYSVKVVKSEGYLADELMNTICFTESSALVYQAVDQGGNDITVSIPSTEYKYIQVIAQVKQGPINEYVAYEAQVIQGVQKTPEQKDNKSAIYAVVGISSALFVIIIILVVVILIYNAKNKDLMEQVNKISFAASNAQSNDDANKNLLLNNNELN